MKSKKWILLGICSLLLQFNLIAQDKLNIKFGKISPADFNLSQQKFDSGANAVIIADIGKTYFEGNRKSDMTMVYTRFMRVKILNKNGFGIAETKIGLYHNDRGDEERLSDLKASTFNLENGQVVETKLDEKSIFTEHYSKRQDFKKFTMPALREGSIYDITYTIKSDFYADLRPWSFQGYYPRLWSEYETTIPPMFYYVSRLQGDNHFDIHSSKEVFEHFSIVQNNGTQSDDFYDLSGNSTRERWVKKNVPALQEEPFTTTVDNYMSRISFQLHYKQWTKTSERFNYLTDWYVASKKLMDDEGFGLSLTHDNAWMTDDLKANTRNCKTDEEKIRSIYTFFRDNFSCTNHEGLWSTSSLKTAYKNRGGNVAEINLLLTAMLRQAHIVADPAILSTRDNGIADQLYPLMDDYNYVICVAYAGDKMFKLDASEPYNGFNHLGVECYNNGARIINAEKPYLIELSADSLRESKLTSVFIVNDEKGYLSGSFKTMLGNEGSYELRKEIKESSVNDYFKKIQTQYGNDVMLKNPGIDSLTRLEDPATVYYDFDLKNLMSGDVIYFNPMMAEIYKNNPFKSAERHYPVEMPFQTKETYVLSMEIPKGYQVDEIPQSARVALNGGDGTFEYLIQKNATNIQMRVSLKLNKAFFPTEDYPTLREFFGYVVKKENEQIVFKKIP